MLNFAASAAPTAPPAAAQTKAVRRGEERSAQETKKRAAESASVVTSAALENQGAQKPKAIAAPHAAPSPPRRRAHSTRAQASSPVRVIRFQKRAVPRSLDEEILF